MDNKKSQQFLQQHQTVLKTLVPLEREIVYARSQKGKPEVIFQIENLDHYKDWLEQLLNIVANINVTSQELDEAITTGTDANQILEAYESAIEELIELHNEVATSQGLDSDLMEGRYLLEHITEQRLEQLSAYINDYRHQVNALIFNCGKELKEAEKVISVAINIDINMRVGLKAFKEWLEVD